MNKTTRTRKHKTKWNYRNIGLLFGAILCIVVVFIAMEKVSAMNKYQDKAIDFGDMHFADGSIIPKQKDWNVTVFTDEKTFVWKTQDVKFDTLDRYNQLYKTPSQDSMVTFEYNQRGKMRNVVIYLSEQDRKDYSKRYADMYKSSMIVRNAFMP